MDSQEFLIPLNGLASGRKHFRWSVGKKFFEEFGNADILDASLDISADAEKSGREVIVDGKVSGTVTVLCDRCMDDLVLPVDTEVRLEVRYEGHGDRPESAADDAGQEDDGEGLALPRRRRLQSVGNRDSVRGHRGERDMGKRPAGRRKHESVQRIAGYFQRKE